MPCSCIHRITSMSLALQYNYQHASSHFGWLQPAFLVELTVKIKAALSPLSKASYPQGEH